MSPRQRSPGYRAVRTPLLHMEAQWLKLMAKCLLGKYLESLSSWTHNALYLRRPHKKLERHSYPWPSFGSLCVKSRVVMPVTFFVLYNLVSPEIQLLPPGYCELYLMYSLSPDSVSVSPVSDLLSVDLRSRPWTLRHPDVCLLTCTGAPLSHSRARPVLASLPSVKQSSGSSRSSASSGIFFRISSGSGQSTVLPSEELVSSIPCKAEPRAVNLALHGAGTSACTHGSTNRLRGGRESLSSPGPTSFPQSPTCLMPTETQHNGVHCSRFEISRPLMEGWQ